MLVEEKARSILSVADYVVFFELGRVVWAGPVSDVDNEGLMASYLGVKTDIDNAVPASPLARRGQ